MRELNLLQAVHEGMVEEMRRDKKVYLMGEEVHTGLGGDVYGTNKGLVGEFGTERIRSTPLSEEGFFGAAVGSAMVGMRPVVDVMLWSFVYLAMDQVVDQAARTRYMFGGQVKVPLVVRGLCGWIPGVAAQHTDSPYAMFMHNPGIKIVVPSTPYDAKGLLKTAIRDDNPVLFFEFAQIAILRGPVPEEEYLVPFGVADVKRKGTDVTVVAIGPMVSKSLAVAEELAKEGISVEVVDPRTLVPMDKETILTSVKKTGRLVIADESWPTCGASAEIAAMVYEDEDAFGCLEAPVQRVTRPANTPIPFSPTMERFVVPDAANIKKAIQKILK